MMMIVRVPVQKKKKTMMQIEKVKEEENSLNQVCKQLCSSFLVTWGIESSEDESEESPP